MVIRSNVSEKRKEKPASGWQSNPGPPSPGFPLSFFNKALRPGASARLVKN